MSVSRLRPVRDPDPGDPARPVRLFVVADDPAVAAFLARIGIEVGLSVRSFAAAADALQAAGRDAPDLLVCHLRQSEASGLDLMGALRTRTPLCEFILVSDVVCGDAVVAAMRQGAVHYLAKPLTVERVRSLLVRTADEVRRRVRVAALEATLAVESAFHGMVGRSPAMQEVFAFLRRVAPYAPTLLVTGETGTGKELVARAVHDLGPRRQGPFVPVNCGALTDTLLESELFGHMRGAFTGAVENRGGLFEAAHGGTLMLDEIGELTAAAQAALLRVLQDGAVRRVGSSTARVIDVHVIASTNRDLGHETEVGRFRPDLYYRISGMQVTLPPVRSRGEDVLLLAHAFLREAATRFERATPELSLGARDALLTYGWPGNVRELRNVVERACMFADGDVLTELDLRLPGSPQAAVPAIRGAGEPPAPTLQTMERELVERALRLAHGNKAAAAGRLGISRRALYRRLEKLGLSAPRSAGAARPDDVENERARSA